ncbi:MAG: glycosyltransferase family 4 protein [Ignavibacteriales bacterium]|nr:glycosyltransferase family 4 protein [Ignavibacteriales bacterium]
MTDAFRKVLMIAYYFPPMGLSGVQRTVKFAKFLPKFGWKPTILTVEPTGYFAIDNSLLKEVEDAGVRILRTGSFDANRLFRKRGVVRMPPEWVRKTLQFFGDVFLIPDTKIGWKRRALKAARELLHKEHFDLIFATAPPQTDFLIGEELKRQFSLPLVLDYRDAWLEYPFKYFPTPLHTFLHRRMERRVVKASYRIITTHRRVKEGLLKRYRFLGYHDVVLITQGFDEEDFSSKERLSRPGVMNIVHAGTFYAGRNPATLLLALSRVLHDNPQVRGRITVTFVGNVRERDRKLVKKLRLQNEVSFPGYLEHRECVNQLQSADVLWFVMDDDNSSPGKLYEYFGSRKTILASVIDGYTKQLLEECKAAIWVSPQDVQAHVNALLDLFSLFEKKKLPKVSDEFANRFNRLSLTGELAKQFESLMDYDRNAFVKVDEVRA